MWPPWRFPRSPKPTGFVQQRPGLAERLFQLTDDEQALVREYHGKISSAVGGAVAARFVQVERRIGTLLDLQLAAEIPLLEPPR